MTEKIPATAEFNTLQGAQQVRWGQHSRNEWYSPGGLGHPLVARIIAEIQANEHLFEGRKIFIGGGVLQPWHSWDIDVFIEGEWSPSVRAALEWVAGLGFHYGVFVDVRLVEAYADVRLWQDTRKVVKFKSYTHSIDFHVDGVNKAENRDYEPYRDIYVTNSQIPVAKNLEMDDKGFKYNYGIRIL